HPLLVVRRAAVGLRRLGLRHREVEAEAFGAVQDARFGNCLATLRDEVDQLQRHARKRANGVQAGDFRVTTEKKPVYEFSDFATLCSASAAIDGRVLSQAPPSLRTHSPSIRKLLRSDLLSLVAR